MPPRNTILQLSTPYTDPMPSNSLSLKVTNFISLLYLTFLTKWPFCWCCYEHGRVLLSKWSLLMRRMQYDRLSQQQLGFLLLLQ